MFAEPAVEILSIIPVAPEVPPVSLSPVVNAPDIAPSTFRCPNISTSNK